MIIRRLVSRSALMIYAVEFTVQKSVRIDFFGAVWYNKDKLWQYG